jgi:hypothetical protein
VTGTKPGMWRPSDAAFYSSKNEAAAKAKGVKRVCVPNHSTKNPCRSCISATSQLEGERSPLCRFGQIVENYLDRSNGFESQRIPQFESDHPSHAVCLGDVQKRCC